jgi:CHAT domain-containing protein/tetratricopeptide (TPR) repeat protein
MRCISHRRRCHPILICLSLIGLGLEPAVTAQTPPATMAAPRPALSAEQEKQIQNWQKSIAELTSQGRFTDTVGPARQIQALCERVLGVDHWRSADARRGIADLDFIARLPEQGRKAIQSTLSLKARMEDSDRKGLYTEAEHVGREHLAINLRWLGEAHTDTAKSYNRLANALMHQGKHAEAEAMHRKVLAIRIAALGEAHPDTAKSYNNLANALLHQGKHVEAEAMSRKSVAILIAAMGEAHPDTAASRLNLANALWSQGKYAEVEAMHRKSVAILIAALGEAHAHTAASCESLANALWSQGKYAEAETMRRKALAIWIAALGEAHPHTARSYNGLAIVLRDQGKYAEAEAMYRKALAIWIAALGEAHPYTALSYSNLAVALESQGKHVEAEAMSRKSVAIQIVALSEGHSDTAASYNNLANALMGQGKYAEAEAMQRKTLAIQFAALGEAHPETAGTYNNLAHALMGQGKYADAEAKYRKALAIWIAALGEAHADTALSYNNLAHALRDQGKYADAEAMARKALAIFIAALGEAHPHTATSHYNLAAIIQAQSRPEEALRALTVAAESFRRVRLLGRRGLESTLAADSSPLPALALALARAGQPRAGWARWEDGLARGVLDEVAGRALRPLTGQERARDDELRGRLQALDEQIGRLVSRPRRSQVDDQQLETLRQQQSEAEGRYLALQNELDAKYREFAGSASGLQEVQAAIPDDAALVGWLDTDWHHGACLLRRTGDPVWVRILGTGADGAWTKDDDKRPGNLRDALAKRATASAADLAASVARQRIGPLRRHLQGVHRLIVLPSPALAGVPVEALLAGEPGPELVVSYAPSASLFARLARPSDQGRKPRSLLAVGDPAYPPPEAEGPAPAPPDAGIAVLRVEPNGLADLYGIRPGDVLLEYGGTKLAKADDLKEVAAEAGAKRIPVKLWRDGESRTIEVGAGKLRILVDPKRKAAEVVLALRTAASVMRPLTRGEFLTRLPGTRREVEAIAFLFPTDRARTLLGDQATESAVNNLASRGELKEYRYLHFATHGRADETIAYNSALLLAPDPDRSANSTAVETDGRITAQQIVNTWVLDADLVVLSGCETALGRATASEGYLGFTQALFARGARSVVLSVWEVDDQATSLLMARFYANLLGRRSGLSKPMPKSEALHEAKTWLHSLKEEQVGPALEALERGGPRPLVTASAPPRSRTEEKGNRPYSHPNYWAAFILVGDPG